MEDLKSLTINGEPREIAATTLAEALAALDYAEAVVATALNGDFVPKRKRAETPLAEAILAARPVAERTRNDRHDLRS